MFIKKLLFLVKLILICIINHLTIKNVMYLKFNSAPAKMCDSFKLIILRIYLILRHFNTFASRKTQQTFTPRNCL